MARKKPGKRKAAKRKATKRKATKRKATKRKAGELVPRPCPTAGCDGLAVDIPTDIVVDARPGSEYWGCGECGNIWEANDPVFVHKKPGM